MWQHDIYIYTYIHTYAYIHYITSHHVTLHYTTLHCPTLHYIIYILYVCMQTTKYMCNKVEWQYMYTVYRQTCVCGCTLSITPFYKAQHRSNPGSSQAGWSPSSRKSQKGNPDQNATVQRKSKKGIVLPDLCVFLVSSKCFPYGGFHQWGYPNSWLVYDGKSPSNMDENWGDPYFRKPPYLDNWPAIRTIIDL